MTAYSWTPKDGTNQLWITSVPVTRTRIVGVDRHHQRVVDVEQARLARLQVGLLGMMLLSKASSLWSGYS